jgi:hypothetical protein
MRAISIPHLQKREGTAPRPLRNECPAAGTRGKPPGTAWQATRDTAANHPGKPPARYARYLPKNVKIFSQPSTAASGR